VSKTIEQTVEFSHVCAQELFDTYLDSRKHGAALGAPVTVRPRVGGEFQAFDGSVTGRIFEIVPGRLIVQSWRGQPWREQDLDSVVILNFLDTRDGARIDLVHANIPDHAYAMINEQAWHERYWYPWKLYLGVPRRSCVRS